MTSQNSDVQPAWAGILDDARATGPDTAPTPDLVEAHRTLTASGVVGTLAVRDTDLPKLRGAALPLRVVLTTGAGGVGGTLGLAARLGLEVAALQVALRDVDDLGGNARRVVAAVDAARGEGVLDDDVRVHVEVPTDLPGGLSGGWARAADEVAAAELALHLRCDGFADVRPDEAARWIDAALDRETPFSVSTSVALSDGQRLGVVNLLLATRRAFDGEGVATVAEVLAGRDPEGVVAEAGSEEYLAATRRWLTSVPTAEPDAVAAALRGTGLTTAG